jgi:predicted esterase YcpF (UPF0227 family)
MYYVCIENNRITSILNYQPSVPSSVEVVEIADEQHEQIIADTHKFDIATKQVVVNPDYSVESNEQELANAVEREFLRSTDWQILRHIRQKALNQTTSLTEEEYLTLEQQRADAAGRIA